MNKHVTDFNEIILPLSREIDREIASDIEKESVFVSPQINRIVVTDDLKSARLIAREGANMQEVADKAKRFLDVMVKQVSGFEIKVFVDTKRKDTGPYQIDVSATV